MKKIIFLILSVVGSLMANAAFPSMVFTTIDGETHFISTDNLEMIFSGEMLMAKSGENELQLPLTTLLSMEFSYADSGIIEISKPSSLIEVFSLDGKACGIFRSVDDARSSLGGGIYVIKKSDGSTIKITLAE